jgi:hypothetical protein
VEQVIAPNVDQVRQALAAHPGPFADLLKLVMARVLQVMGRTPAGGVAKMVIGEARNFPELARVWHDRLVSQTIAALAGAIEAAQARGEVRPGDPRLIAMQIMAPMLVGVIWRETFTPIGAPDVDLETLAAQHVEVLLDGLLLKAAA